MALVAHVRVEVHSHDWAFIGVLGILQAVVRELCLPVCRLPISAALGMVAGSWEGVCRKRTSGGDKCADFDFG